jgi:predicted transcriptional regulator
MSDSPSPLLGLTAQIVAAHVSNNQTSPEGLLRLIESVYQALASSGQEAISAEKQQPAVPVKRSVFPDHIICLEDGKSLTMLKRHLRVSYGLTPDQYREKWGLPRDYPMVAPDYAARRSATAKRIGLGRRPASEPEPEPMVVEEVAPRRRGRPRKQPAAA